MKPPSHFIFCLMLCLIVTAFSHLHLPFTDPDVDAIVAMGFTPQQAVHALSLNSNVQDAVSYLGDHPHVTGLETGKSNLFSMFVHKGGVAAVCLVLSACCQDRLQGAFLRYSYCC